MLHRTPERLRGLPRPGVGVRKVQIMYVAMFPYLPSFGSIGPRNMPADLPLALGRAAATLREVLDLV